VAGIRQDRHHHARQTVLTETVLLDQTDRVDAVRVATSLAARSDHPVSLAIAASGQRNGTVLLDVADFAAIPGRGVLGTVGGVRYQLGNHRLIHELGVCTPPCGGSAW
jgi:Cd2+/Zn2+-exporting ATPase